jgi:hypothetical protein
MKPLTTAQRNALKALTACCDTALGTSGTPLGYTYSRAVAFELWPNSIAWNRRARRHDGRSGALGATMPMKAATMLWKLQARGLATLEGTARWSVTDLGRRTLNI